MTDVTLRTLGAGTTISVGDLFLTRQGADTVDTSVTGTQLLAFARTAQGTAAYENVGTGANEVVQLDGSAKLPAVDGSQLTNLPAGVTTLAALTDVLQTSNNLVLSGSAPSGFSGTGNTSFGIGALHSNTGVNSTGIGYGALIINAAADNVALGFLAGTALTSGSQNTAVGSGSLITATVSTDSTAIGEHALYNADGNYNTALGSGAGITITTGIQNTIIGKSADVNSAAAANRIAIGYTAVCTADNTAQIGNALITDVTLGNATAKIHADGSQLSGMAAVVATVTTPTILDSTQYLQLTVGGTTYNIGIVTPGT